MIKFNYILDYQKIPPSISIIIRRNENAAIECEPLAIGRHLYVRCFYIRLILPSKNVHCSIGLRSGE